MSCTGSPGLRSSSTSQRVPVFVKQQRGGARGFSIIALALMQGLDQ